MRVILAGGGTGGHVIPALAIAHELKADGDEIIFIGTRRGLETRLVPNAGFELRLVQVGMLKNVNWITRLKTVFDLPRAIFRAGRIISKFRPNVIIGVGGYASGPAMLAAAAMGVPSVAFEPNVVPGFANRRLGPAVAAAAVQFRETCRYFRNCSVTGVPVRRDFFSIRSKPPVSTPTLLIFGGSQGAKRINEVAIESLGALTAAIPNLHIIHQTGEHDYDHAQAAYLQLGISAEVSPFIDNMPEAFSRADLLICRSGASTVAEIMAAGKPAIFVPFPRAADDHQRRNAEALVRMGAALLFPQAELSSPRLVEFVAKLMRDRETLALMGAAARAHARPNAARDIAALARRVAR